MDVFNKRNAVVGYLTIQALQRRKWNRRFRAVKIVGLVALGIVSVGILAAVVAVVVRRQRDGALEAVVDEAAAWGPTELEAEFHEPSYTS